MGNVVLVGVILHVDGVIDTLVLLSAFTVFMFATLTDLLVVAVAVRLVFALWLFWVVSKSVNAS